RSERRPLGVHGNAILTGRHGLGRSEIARLYGQGLSELDLIGVGQLVRVSLSGELRPQWPGQAESLVHRAVRAAQGGVLVVVADGGAIEAAAALWAAVRAQPADPVIVLIGDERDVDVLLERFPDLPEFFPRRWHFGEYTAADLAEIAARHLRERGHDVPDDVVVAVREHIEAAGLGTVHSVHRLAGHLARTAASRTLTSADLTGLAGSVPVADGLASVG
ncbi:MAG: ATPase, partial [Kibdelosporangium sp.]